MLKFIPGNQIQLLCNGTEYFPALELAIAQAQFEIYLETYIYEADVVGVRIGEALANAAQRGVKVRLLIDGFGSKDLDQDFVKSLQIKGVEILFYRPKVSPWTLKKNRLRRLHRKVSVFDGRVAFVGGINIIDDFNVPHQTPPRIDYAVRVEGALLPAIHQSVRRLWQKIAWVHLQVTSGRQAIAKPIYIEGGVKASFVMRDNVLRRREIEHAYLQAIAQANTEIFIANAYFAPGKKFRNALLQAAKRGVRVRLLLQGRMEYFVMFATYAFYRQFLKAGVEIYEYRRSFMHSKVAVIDHHWATVGSSNIDPFSLLLAREANVVVQDSVFASQLKHTMEQTLYEGAQLVSLEDWQQHGIVKRFFSWVAYGMLRLFTAFIHQRY
jgi:cardiolipin synthase A/B